MQTKNLECWRSMWGEKTPKVRKIKVWRHARQREVKWKKYLKEADVPLVGCFANDTENRFTAGIANNSEEIKKKKITRVTFFQPQVLVNHVQSFSCFSDVEHWWCTASFPSVRGPWLTLVWMFEDTNEAKHGRTSTDECEVKKSLDWEDEGRGNKK